MKERTRLNHPPTVDVPADNLPLTAPIYQNVKFEYPGVAETLKGLRGAREGFYYSRISNPTTRQLELTLAAMQGREEAVVCASGVGAIAQALIGLLKQGDHVLCFAETYGPTRSLITRTLARYGVTHTMLSIEDDAGIEGVLASTPTKLVVFESPTNPVTKIADIARLTRAARAHGALTMLDNTFAGPHQHGQYDIDFFVHSLTKFVSGHGDVMGGAVIASADLLRPLRQDFVLLGGTLDPHAAYLLQRGLKTYYLRYEAQCATAQQVAEYLAAHPAVERVHYPGLATHPRHALAREQLRDFGAVVSFDLRAGAEAGNRLADSLELFSITSSLGSTESLVIPPALMSVHDLPAPLQPRCGIAPGTVRLSIGLDDAEDLIADLSQALG